MINQNVEIFTLLNGINWNIINVKNYKYKEYKKQPLEYFHILRLFSFEIVSVFP